MHELKLILRKIWIIRVIKKFSQLRYISLIYFLNGTHSYHGIYFLIQSLPRLTIKMHCTLAAVPVKII